MRTDRDMPIQGSTPPTTGRRLLSLSEVAARLEHRLYGSDQGALALQEGCRFAVCHELSSVIALPRAVATVASYLAGTSVGVVTIPGWHDNGVEPLPTRMLLAEAERLAAQGATDVGLLAGADRLTTNKRRQFADDVSEMVAAMQALNVRVRVVLDTDGLDPHATAATCELLGTTGAWLVQGGSWRGARTGLTRMQLIRASLPCQVRLKWTFPVRSLDMMLVCIAEGVDLFNGDPPSLLKDAAQRLAGGPLPIPVDGVDYLAFRAPI